MADSVSRTRIVVCSVGREAYKHGQPSGRRLTGGECAHLAVSTAAASKDVAASGCTLSCLAKIGHLCHPLEVTAI